MEFYKILDDEQPQKFRKKLVKLTFAELQMNFQYK